MAQEIERKFLVVSDEWRDTAERSTVYRQAYLANTGRVSIRVRIAGAKANINLKSARLGIERDEFEYPVPVDEAAQLMRLRDGAVIEKTRHFVHHEAHLWEVDVFSGANEGLVVAEIELDSIDESFVRPRWLGAEVSDDPRYYNVRLAVHPFCEWKISSNPAGS